MQRFVYEGSKTKEIAFPLGGIGSGCVSLAGNGRLVDWEIYNKPNKGGTNGFTHFAIKAEQDGKLLDARVLQGALQPPYSGQGGSTAHRGFGFGPGSHTMAGFPHFEDVRFIGEFPLAELAFADSHFPGQVAMTAFNPFIPSNDKDSSIPGAFFEFECLNTTDQALDYTIAFTAGNPFASKESWNRHVRRDGFHMIQQGSYLYEPTQPEYGELSIATDTAQVSYQEYGYRGRWVDGLETFWRNFTTPGPFRNRTYPKEPAAQVPDFAVMAAHVTVAPGARERIRFVLTWHFPNFRNYWSPETEQAADGACCAPGEACAPAETGRNTWRNYYATLFEDSTASAAYALKEWGRLYRDTKLFKDALFSSTLPPEALDAVSANLSTLKSPTVLRLEDGSFYGFEGCSPQAGCCPGTCTHVWTYAYALPFLFPKLERSLRELEYTYSMREDGHIGFRFQLPLGRPNRHGSCADGQFGGVIKVYREWKISGDDEWLRALWPKVKKSIEYAWADTNSHKWDLDKDGVLEGRQHHTLDMELFGPNAWLNGFYLAALKAGAEMAEYVGDPDAAEEFGGLFRKGKQWTDENLFNGEYYAQLLNLQDKSMLERFGDDAVRHYWNEETGEIKYQIVEGCGIDQVLAQWHANLTGLGEIFDPEQTRKSLASIYKHNFKSMRNFANPWRLYSLNDEQGLLICTWPEGRAKPTLPLTYNSETMNGFEYQAAIHMIQEGMVEEGMSVVKAIRDRYDGERRNPWNEFECGSHYARSMASYALLLTFSGFTYDLPRRTIGFAPLETALDETGAFSSFWSLDGTWGTFRQTGDGCELTVLQGTLTIDKLSLSFLNGRASAGAEADGRKMAVELEDGALRFAATLELQAGTTLTVKG